MKIDVLGAEYTLTVIRGSKEPRLKDCDGFCDETTKEMLVENYEDSKGEPNCKQNLLVQTNKVKRHEIIHAFLFESRKFQLGAERGNGGFLRNPVSKTAESI